MAFYLGMDGGGSKTACVIGDDAAVLGKGESGPSNVVRVGEANARGAIHAAITQACGVAGVSPQQISRTCVGAAGAARQEVRETVRRFVAEVVPGEIEVVADTVIALRAAFRGAPGVIVISGTGSIAYGRNAQGHTARAGGWGPAISDEGSGHWIGRMAVAAALQAEAEGKSTVLLLDMLKAWQLRTSEQLVLSANGSPPPNFAELAPIVLAAADSGDGIGREVLDRAGIELAALGKAVIQLLFSSGETVKVAMYGGVFANSPQVCGSFYNSLRSEFPGVEVCSEPAPPVMGALDLAREMGR